MRLISSTLIFLFLYFLVCFRAFSAPLPAPSRLHGSETYHSQNGVVQSWWTLSDEGGNWRVRQFTAVGSELQDFVGESAFSSKNRALRSIQLGVTKFSRSDFNQTAIPAEQAWGAEDVIWETTQAWTVESEELYKKWISENYDKSFFVRYNIATDCADAVYALRWIFARIHGLPAGNFIGGSRAFFTNESMKREWRKLPTDPEWSKDQRFLAALNYLMENTYTHTLFDDSYPIAIHQQTFGPGTFHLQVRQVSGHVRIVNPSKDPS